MIKSRVANNAIWIIICKIAQSILGIIISALSARYLGPSNFGLISYAASIAAFAIPITQLGLNCTIVKELIDNPDDEGLILGTSVFMSLISSFFCMLGTYLTVSFLNRNETIAIVVCLLYSTMLLFVATELIIFWFQAHYYSKYASISSLIAYVVVSLYKIYLLVTSKGVEWFALSYSMDYCLISIGLLFFYHKLGGKRLKLSFSTGRRLLSNSWTFIISGLLAVIYAQTDRIMLKNMVGNTESGYYSAATTTAVMASFIFSAIIDSMRPYVFEGKQESDSVFKKRIKYLYSIVFYLSALYSIICFVFATPIINILYGKEYQSSIKILQVMVWYTVFNYYGGAQSVWFLAEKKQKYLVLFGGLGALLNIVLNLALIPLLGGMGAGIATLVSAIITNVVLCLIIKSTRKTVFLLFSSINPKVILSLLKLRK